MKKQILIASLSALIFIQTSTASFAGMPVVCENCSDLITQLLGLVTDFEQLGEAVASYEELYTQTMQNVEQIQQAYDRYSNMLKNTASLPENIKAKLTAQFKQLVSGIEDVGSYYGDLSAIQQIYEQLYPNYQDLANEITKSGVPLPERVEAYRERYEEWSAESYEATKRVFGLTGQQLQDLVNSGQFEAQVAELLSTPEGQKEALDAGNQLAGMQLDESRHLRALLATHIQAQQQLVMKEQMTKDSKQEERMKFYESENKDSLSDMQMPLGW